MVFYVLNTGSVNVIRTNSSCIITLVLKSLELYLKDTIRKQDLDECLSGLGMYDREMF